ncbi:MAG: hypothetical protein ACYS47_00830 [Planctomycetota bacterium]|jgi:hypothetical protein
MIHGVPGLAHTGLPGPEVLLFAAAGFLAAALFLLSLLRQVRRLAAEGRPGLGLPVLYVGRVGLAGGFLGALVLCGPWSALAGLAGFVAGRTLLAGPFARRLGP